MADRRLVRSAPMPYDATQYAVVHVNYTESVSTKCSELSGGETAAAVVVVSTCRIYSYRRVGGARDMSLIICSNAYTLLYCMLSSMVVIHTVQ